MIAAGLTDSVTLTFLVQITHGDIIVGGGSIQIQINKRTNTTL